MVFQRCVAQSGPIADLFLREPARAAICRGGAVVERSLAMDKVAFGQVLGTVGSMLAETEALFETDLLAHSIPS